MFIFSFIWEDLVQDHTVSRRRREDVIGHDFLNNKDATEGVGRFGRLGEREESS